MKQCKKDLLGVWIPLIVAFVGYLILQIIEFGIVSIILSISIIIIGVVILIYVDNIEVEVNENITTHEHR